MPYAGLKVYIILFVFETKVITIEWNLIKGDGKALLKEFMSGKGFKLIQEFNGHWTQDLIFMNS